MNTVSGIITGITLVKGPMTVKALHKTMRGEVILNEVLTAFCKDGKSGTIFVLWNDTAQSPAATDYNYGSVNTTRQPLSVRNPLPNLTIQILRLMRH